MIFGTVLVINLDKYSFIVTVNIRHFKVELTFFPGPLRVQLNGISMYMYNIIYNIIYST